MQPSDLINSIPRGSVLAFREIYRQQHIGPHYNGWAHFCFTSFGSLAVVALSAMQVHDVTRYQWLTIPLAFLIANVSEYLGHKGPMHHPKSGMRILFERHTEQHHRFFTDQAMSYESARDFKMVLFPPAMLFFFLIILAGPISVVFFLTGGWNAGWLFVSSAMAYFLAYEWLHLSYHLRESSWVGRLPGMRALRKHHTFHHDTTVMTQWNFNITFPICDVLFGTKYRGGR